MKKPKLNVTKEENGKKNDNACSRIEKRCGFDEAVSNSKLA